MGVLLLLHLTLDVTSRRLSEFFVLAPHQATKDDVDDSKDEPEEEQAFEATDDKQCRGDHDQDREGESLFAALSRTQLAAEGRALDDEEQNDTDDRQEVTGHAEHCCNHGRPICNGNGGCKNANEPEAL